MRLSIIIPFADEWPQVIFTIQSIAQTLLGRIDFEIIAVDNECKELRDQINKKVDRARQADGGLADDLENKSRKSTEAIKACAKYNNWLRYENYSKKLSHWQAKNLGVSVSIGDILWFCDAHCIAGRNSVYDMLIEYEKNYDKYNGTIHLPLTYKILEPRKLIYKLVFKWETAEIHYSFTGFREAQKPYEVSVMSTCGMMISREIFNEIGGWPTELGIYGGGENFINFTTAVMGKKKWIYPLGVLHHHGEGRDYHWYYDDQVRNKMIAMYIYGGETLVRRFIQNTKGRPDTLKNICDDVIQKCKDHRELVKRKQVMTIDQWATKWLNK